jgi:hypothetical protein
MTKLRSVDGPISFAQGKLGRLFPYMNQETKNGASLRGQPRAAIPT